MHEFSNFIENETFFLRKNENINFQRCKFFKSIETIFHGIKYKLYILLA